MTEFALFSASACIERGFPTEADALTRLAVLEVNGEVTQSGDDPVTAEQMCPIHDDEPASACTYCFGDVVHDAALTLIALNEEDGE